MKNFHRSFVFVSPGFLSRNFPWDFSKKKIGTIRWKHIQNHLFEEIFEAKAVSIQKSKYHVWNLEKIQNEYFGWNSEKFLKVLPSSVARSRISLAGKRFPGITFPEQIVIKFCFRNSLTKCSPANFQDLRPSF